MNITSDELNEIKSFDVIFVGHLSSVTAHMFAIMTKNAYKSLVLSNIKLITIETEKTIIEPSLMPISTEEIKITKKIKHPSVSRKYTKTIKIKPISKQIEIDSQKMYDYKYLVYTGNIENWTDYSSIKTLEEALSNDYSLVYSNIKKRDISAVSKKISSGNVVFYIPNGNHSGYDNFDFLSVCQKMKENLQSKEENYLKPLTFKIILEGTSLYPYSQEVDKLIKKEIHERGIELSYNSKLTKIDYLRRTLTINDSYQVPYNMLYCTMPQKIPDVLKDAEINPFENNPKTLLNKKFRNIFIFGADIFPTTHTFEAIQYQSRIVSRNLIHLLSFSEKISLYNGHTLIPMYINENEIVNIVHNYAELNNWSDNEEEKVKVSKSCTWLAYLTAKMSQFYLTESYYNYNSWGSPYYIFGPELKSVKFVQEEKPNYTEEMINTKEKNKKIDDSEFETKMNKTAEKHKNLPRYSK